MVSTAHEQEDVKGTLHLEEVQNGDAISRKNIAPDGGWGWVVCFAFFMLNLISEGVGSSLTLVFVELLDYFNGNKADTSWILSLNYSVCFLIGPIVATLTDRFGCRAVVFAGTLVVVASTIISIFSPNLYFLYFSLGLLPGIGNGMLYMPGFVCLSEYFDKRLALATGLCVCGSGLGIFLFSPLTALLIETYTWRGALLIQAGLLLNCLACSLVYKPLTNDEKSHRPEENTLLNSNKANTDTSSSTQDIDIFNKKFEIEISKEDRQKDIFNSPSYIETVVLELTTDVNNDNRVESLGHKNHVCFNSFRSVMFRAINKFSFPKFVSLQQFRNTAFVLFTLSSFISDFGFYPPYVYLAVKSNDQGVGEIETAWIISATGITSTVGRVVIGFFSDRKWVNRLYLYITALVICGIATSMGPVLNSFAHLLIYAMIFGLCSGTSATLLSILIGDIVGTENLPHALGIASFFSGIGILIGPPLGGWLSDVSGSYDGLFLASGISLAFAGTILCLIPCIDRNWKKR